MAEDGSFVFSKECYEERDDYHYPQWTAVENVEKPGLMSKGRKHEERNRATQEEGDLVETGTYRCKEGNSYHS